MKFILSIFIILNLIGSLAALEFQADANTVALWHFNEGSGDSLFDSSGNGNHGKIFGATWVDGMSGKALSFNGTDNFVEIADKAIQTGMSELTIAAFIRYSSPQSGISSFVSKWGPGGSGDDSYFLGIYPDTIIHLAINNGGYKALYSDLSVPYNTWNYIVGRYGKGKCEIFLNGELICSTQVGTGSINDVDLPICIGKHMASGDFLKGELDEIRISNIARSVSEIAAHWEANQGLFTLDSGLVAYFPFNGNANDESENGNDGTVHGATLTTDRFGNTNSAYSFDGQNDWIKVENSNSLNIFGYNSLSICAWIKAESFKSGNTGVVNKWGTGGAEDDQYKLNLYSDKVKFGLSDEPTNLVSISGIQLNKWYFITGVYDNAESKIKVYIDGKLDNEMDLSFSIWNTNQFIEIGTHHGSFFHGVVDDIRIYNLALSDTEIQALYQGTPNNNLSIITIPIPSPTFERRPLFSWHPVGSINEYTIQIDTLSNLANPIIRLTTTDTTFTPLADLPMQTIYWRVGAGSPIIYSKVDSFVIQNPMIPMLIAYEPNPTQDRRPTLTWHSVDDTSVYHIMIDNNSNFSSAEVSLAITDTSFTPLSDLPYGMIYWKVKSDLYDEYSTASTFYIQPDTIPFLYAFNGSTTSDKRPEFMWIPVTSATTYKIQIDTSLDFTSPITSIEISDTSFTPLSDLGNRMYYWRVSCDLNFSAFSQIDSIEINTGTSIEGNDNSITETILSIYPMPFNSKATIYFHNHLKNGIVSIFSINGKNVITFRNVRQNHIRWNALGHPSGIYVVKVDTGKKILKKQIVLVKLL
jgi:hypothetical protein